MIGAVDELEPLLQLDNTTCALAAAHSATASLIQQGFRARIEGGHIAIAEAVQAQFGEPFRLLNAMRRAAEQLPNLTIWRP